MGKIIKGDFVVVNKIYHSDKSVGIESGDIFEVQSVDVDGDILVELDGGSEWILTHNQVELVEEMRCDDMDIEKGDLVIVKSLMMYDKENDIKIDDVYEVKEIDDNGDYVIELKNGSEWLLSDDQIELAEKDKKDEHTDYHALESAIREVDREIAQRALELEMLKEAREKMYKVLMMNGK